MLPNPPPHWQTDTYENITFQQIIYIINLRYIEIWFFFLATTIAIPKLWNVYNHLGASDTFMCMTLPLGFLDYFCTTDVPNQVFHKLDDNGIFVFTAWK